MPAYTPVTAKSHASKRWVRFSSYAFAAQSTLVQLVAADLPKAVMSLPVAFRPDGEGIMPVAVMSLEPGRNLFVAPDGRWIGGYVPSALRGHPFRLLPTPEGRHVLCVDEESGLIVDGPEGEPILDGAGGLAPAVQDVARFLAKVEENRVATARACAALLRHGVVRPWPVLARTEGGDRKVEGLLHVDEAALNGLPADAFEELRQAGALQVSYCQMLSAQHLELLGRLAAARARMQPASARPLEGVLTSPHEGNLEIDWSAFSQDAGTDRA